MTCKWELWNKKEIDRDVTWTDSGNKMRTRMRNGNPGTSDKIGFTDLLRRKFGMQISLMSRSESSQF